jgi:hypothetical protein
VTELSYTPQFEHLDWIDRVDQVVAGGPNGFNVRFRAIEHDLQQASTVVSDIATALHTTHRPPPGGLAPPTQLTFTPNLHPVPSTHSFTPGPNGAPTGTSLFTRSTGGGAGVGIAASGVANMSLPEGLRVTIVRFVGAIDGSGGSTINKATLALVRSAIPVTGPVVETLASVQATGTGAFDLQATVPTNQAVTDIHGFRYAVKVQLEALSNGSSALTVEYVQITFAPPA